MTIFGSVGLRWDSVSGQRSAARLSKDTAREAGWPVCAASFFKNNKDNIDPDGGKKLTLNVAADGSPVSQ
jgi:hypothetical protein